ncbi:MAG TPA: D-glycerate dehydrogenase, partial [Acidimicrobiia bacterium]
MADIMVTRALPPDILAPLLVRGGVEVWEGEGPMRREVLLDSVADAVGVLSMLTDSIDADLIEAAPRLMVVSQMAAGVDNIDLDAC